MVRRRVNIIKRHKDLVLYYGAHYAVLTALWVDSEWAIIGLEPFQQTIVLAYIVLGAVSFPLAYWIGRRAERREKDNREEIFVPIPQDVSAYFPPREVLISEMFQISRFGDRLPEPAK